MNLQRKTGLDIIKVLAICVVMITHMFNKTQVLDSDIRSAPWTVFAFIKFFAIIGVPLFLLLTGYLQSGRGLNSKHYTSIIPVMLSYFVISSVNAVAEVMVVDAEVNVFQLVVSIFDFEYGYAWYVEMYIGLFLLIPFLNIMYERLERRHKLLLIGILAFLSFMPATLQYFTVCESGFEILPDFFSNLYVIAYYFIGAYIAEFRPSPKKYHCVTVGLLVLMAETALCYYFSDGGYAWWLFNNVASVTHAVVAVCVFLFFYNRDIKKKIMSVPAKLVAVCSFEMYLLSYMTDNFCYRYLTFPIWLILVINFFMAFVGANIVRAVVVPLGNVIRKSILKK